MAQNRECQQARGHGARDAVKDTKNQLHYLNSSGDFWPAQEFVPAEELV
jgi:hypothetical protein